MFDVQLPALSYKQNYDHHNLITATTQKKRQKMFYFWLQMYGQILNTLETCTLWQVFTHM